MYACLTVGARFCQTGRLKLARLSGFEVDWVFFGFFGFVLFCFVVFFFCLLEYMYPLIGGNGQTVNVH
jgi:hypothetical protein